jgi:hypothetical protein
VKLRCFIFFTLLFLSSSVLAQKDSTTNSMSGWSVAALFRYGHIIRHTPKIILNISHPTYAGEVDIEKQTTGTRLWQQYYHYPIFGVGLLYTYYGNPVLGSSIALFPYMTIHLVTSKIIDWRFTLADGICYITNPYNVITNPTNNIIGTTINDITRFSTSLQYKPNTHFAIGIGGSFTHFSNGAVAFPNLGINIPAIDFTGRYTFSTAPRIHTPKSEWPAINRRLQMQFKLGIGWEQHNPPDGPNERVYLAAFSIGRYISRINRLSVGVESGYSTDIYNYIKLEEILPINFASAVRASAFISDEFLFSRFGLLIHYGYYFYYPVLKPADTNEKLGLHYYFLKYDKKTSNRLFVGIYLSAYQISAEFVETSIGIEF